MLKLERLGFLKRSSDIGRKISLKIPSENRYIKKISGRILSDIKPYRVSEENAFDIKLCVEEAVRNAIVHGNHSNRSKTVTTTFWMDGGHLMIEVEDEGSGFDHRNLPDPTDANYIMRNSGRGVYLIRKLMNCVEFNQTGNKITMVKKIK